MTLPRIEHANRPAKPKRTASTSQYQRFYNERPMSRSNNKSLNLHIFAQQQSQ